MVKNYFQSLNYGRDENSTLLNRFIKCHEQKNTNLIWFDSSRNPGTVSRTETVREDTLSRITIGRPVRVLINS